MAKRKRYAKPTRGPRKPGYPPFVPTDEQRNFVEAMSGIKMTWDEIRQLVVNPQTGLPINKTTLGKAFKRELAVGKAQHKSLIARVLRGAESS
jgi:hypothetical protein